MLVGGLRRTWGGMFQKRISAGFADSEKDIKARIKSISSTKKITKAMKMVATAKMRAEVDRLEAGKHFGVHVVPTMFENDEWMMKRAGEIVPQRTLIVPVTTDKGLCGGINASIVRDTREFLKERDQSKYSLLIIGDKGTIGLQRLFPDLILGSITELVQPANFYVEKSNPEHICNRKHHF